MADTLALDLTGLDSADVRGLMAFVQQLRSKAPASVDDETWRTAPSTGWTRMHLDLLRDHLQARGKHVQLAALDRAIANGGFVTREEVYSLGNYAETRRLNNWSAPILGYVEILVAHHGLPADAEPPIVTEYGPGTGFRPAKGFHVAPELIRLGRES